MPGPLGIFDPIRADYPAQVSPYTDITIGALTALSAFGMVGVGAFFTYEAAATGQATTVTYVTGGQTLVYAGGTTLTAGQAAIVAVIESGGLASEPVAVSAILTSWGLELMSLEGLIALAAYDVSLLHDPTMYGNFGQYLGNWIGGGPGNPGGFATPPGFPGFPGFGYPVGQGFWACIRAGEDGWDCQWHWMN